MCIRNGSLRLNESHLPVPDGGTDNGVEVVVLPEAVVVEAEFLAGRATEVDALAQIRASLVVDEVLRHAVDIVRHQVLQLFGRGTALGC